MVPALESVKGRDLTNVSSLSSDSPETRRDPTNPAEIVTLCQSHQSSAPSSDAALSRPALSGAIKGLVNVLMDVTMSQMSQCQNVTKSVCQNVRICKNPYFVTTKHKIYALIINLIVRSQFIIHLFENLVPTEGRRKFHQYYSILKY